MADYDDFVPKAKDLSQRVILNLSRSQAIYLAAVLTAVLRRADLDEQTEGVVTDTVQLIGLQLRHSMVRHDRAKRAPFPL